MAREVLSDGMPTYLQWTEEWFIGACLIAAEADVMTLATTIEPSDFRDRSLGQVWEAIRTGGTSLPEVCRTLQEWGELDDVGSEMRLAHLAASEGAMVYSGLPSLKAHAGIIKDWSNRRKVIKEASETAQSVYAGAPVRHGVSVGARSLFKA